MRSALAHAAQKRAERRHRASSLSTVPPAETSHDYDPELAATAASILYRTPILSQFGRPIYVLNAAAFPDTFDVDYDALLSYVLARLPGEDALLSGTEYEIVFFAGGPPDNATSEKKQGPGMGWYLQAYHVLSRATRKRLQKMYIVHPRTWVRVLVGVFGTIVSPKFRRKIVHVNTLSALALQMPMEKLLIPPSVYLHDRKMSPDIYVPYVTGKRAFGVKHPFPKNITTGETRLPRVLREATTFIVSPSNIRKEGLFRIPGHSTLISVLKEAYDRGQHFIIWKEGGATVVSPGVEQSVLDDVRVEDCYSLHLACSLVKQWYRDLRDPIFPESCYDSLRERYLNPDTPVTLEDLEELILPNSVISPLAPTAREILTRHLLPLLSAIASHEAENKMNADNLSILFSMCLVCGSNQMDDARMATMVKRVLQAAVDMWPQLREEMGMSANGFHDDLRAPTDARQYEDPLEENVSPPQDEPRWKEDGGDDLIQHEEHRITLEDAESSPVKAAAPKLPLRILDRSDPSRVPPLPARPVLVTTTPTGSSATSSNAETASMFPKRKPAPPILDPPRYSSVFDGDGNSIHVEYSPASYTPADGFGPPKHDAWGFDEREKKGFPADESSNASMAPPPILFPRRKVPSADEKRESTASTWSHDSTSTRSASEGSALAMMAAEIGARKMSKQNGQTSAPSSDAGNPATFPTGLATAETVASSAPSSDAGGLAKSCEAVLSEGDGVFRKPSWPASARQQSLAKPIHPLRHTQTFPFSIDGNHLSASNSGVPRPRAPSPGLLKRMSSMEVVGSAGSAPEAGRLIEPRRLDLKRPSVDDLKRLYEERAHTVLGLAEAHAHAARRASTSN